MTDAVYAAVGSITVVGMLTHCVLLATMSDLNATQMIMQHSLILQLYEFKQSHNTAEAAKTKR